MENLPSEMRYTDGDVDTNVSANPTLESIVNERYSRRQTLVGGVSATTLAVFGTALLAGCGEDSAPVVNAGQNGTSSSGRVVQLTATAADPDGIKTSAWTQVSGPTVTLTGANATSASFIAPSVSSATDLKFSFVATDSKGDSTTAETTVTVMPAALGFNPVAKNRNDVVTVPEGYTATVLYRLGDPLAAGVPTYANDGSDTNFAQRAGDHHDAMCYFGLNAAGTARDDNSSTRGLLVINHENISEQYLHANGPTSVGGVRPEAEAIKEIEAHGVAIVEVSEGANRAWSYNQASSYNRRLTPNTPMTLHGPARGNALMKTAYSTDGTQARGTINNCANGYTPWGTSLNCEENWAGYFKRPTATDNPNRTAAGGDNVKSIESLRRYGVTSATGANGWSTVVPANAANTTFRRWDATVNPTAAADGTGDFRFEPNQFGWVVEIDPYDPSSTPRKRTALGRMGHEGAWPSRFVAGVKPAFYMGDDSRGEYFWKFVSAAAWDAADANRSDRLAVGDKYLDNGTLYVAKFNADGSGTWMPLIFGQGPITAANATYPFADQGDVVINCRLAADALGATKMDRPEWTATNPATGEVYLTLTNNSAALRPLNGTDAANPRHYNDPKGTTNQYGNPNGHIIRIRETGDRSDATGFTWDIYAFGAGSDLDPANINISGLDATNDFSSPDGLWFSRDTNAAGKVKPVMWLQTDDGAYTDVTNCMMLAAQPGTVGDGSTKTITNKDSTGATATQTTRVGAAPGTNLRRFLVGPKECEITGVDSTPDGRTLFVNIQHPGEGGTPTAPSSNWPQSQSGNATGRPRSATIVITKNDGGVIAL